VVVTFRAENLQYEAIKAADRTKITMTDYMYCNRKSHKRF